MVTARLALLEFGRGKGDEMRKAIINTENGRIENIIEIDGKSNYKTPAGFDLLDEITTSKVEIGGTWDGHTFTAKTPVEMPAQVDIEKLASDIEALKSDISALKTDVITIKSINEVTK